MDPGVDPALDAVEAVDDLTLGLRCALGNLAHTQLNHVLDVGHAGLQLAIGLRDIVGQHLHTRFQRQFNVAAPGR